METQGKFFVVLIAVCIILISMVLHADVPHLISYQGRIMDSKTGEPVSDGTYDFTFRLYGGEDTEYSFWSETHYNVQVSNGLYNVMLGSVTEFDNIDFSSQYWLGVQMGIAPEMTPRYQLSASPYALNIADEVITTEKIQDGQVTQDDLHGRVTFAEITDGEGEHQFTLSKHNPKLQFIGEGYADVDFDEENQTIIIGVGSSGGRGKSDNEWTSAGTIVYLTDSLDSVGIGTATPGKKLEVVGDIKGDTFFVDAELDMQSKNIVDVDSIVGSGHIYMPTGLEIIYPWNASDSIKQDTAIVIDVGKYGVHITALDSEWVTVPTPKWDLVGEYGVYAESHTRAVYGTATKEAVYGEANKEMGVMGDAPDYGVFGKAQKTYGVYGGADSLYGVYGNSLIDYGVYGEALNDYGVYGDADSGYGVYGKAPKYGVYGDADDYGVYGYSKQKHGGYFYADLNYSLACSSSDSSDTTLWVKKGMSVFDGKGKFDDSLTIGEYKLPVTAGSKNQFLVLDDASRLGWVNIDTLFCDTCVPWLLFEDVVFTSNWQTSVETCTVSFYGVAKGNAGNTLAGIRRTHVNLGANSITGVSDDDSFCTVGGGRSNLVRDVFTTVSGGVGDTVIGGFSFIGGGNNNYIKGEYSVITGGCSNYINDGYSTIGGGEKDTVVSAWGGVFSGYGNFAGSVEADTGVFIGGGWWNKALAKFSVICGGDSNNVESIALHSVICGGTHNYDSASHSFIGGGDSNSIYADSSVISGGSTNIIRVKGGTISGGKRNIIETGASEVAAKWGTIGGGDSNIVFSEYGTIGGGWDNRAGLHSTVGGGDHNRALKTGSTVAGGDGNEAQEQFSSIGGGHLNINSGVCSFIGAGAGNLINTVGLTDYSVIGGGVGNQIDTLLGVIGGGAGNLVSGYSAVITGGDSNTVDAILGFIGGGFNNKITANGEYSVIAGGDSNKTFNSYNVISGGSYNSSVYDFSTICGGFSNDAVRHYSTICGGDSNLANGNNSIIGGGRSNSVDPGANFSGVFCGFANTIDDSIFYATIGGGYQNLIFGKYGGIFSGIQNKVVCASALDTNASFIGGGYQDSIYGKFSVIGGGESNIIKSDYGTIGGGFKNEVESNYATIAGGGENFASGTGAMVCGGYNNKADGLYATTSGYTDTVDGDYSAIPGGYKNKVAGDYSFAFGCSVRVNSNNVSVFYDSLNPGKFGINVPNPETALHIKGSMATAVHHISAALDSLKTIDHSGFVSVPADSDTVYIPNPNDVTGRIYFIKNKHSSKPFYLVPKANSVENNPQILIEPKEAVIIQSDGLSNWWIMSRYSP